MKKILKFLKSAKAKVVSMIISTTILTANVVFADASSTATQALDYGMNLVAVIPTGMAIFAFINAGIAFSQSQQEGGNAQASAKMSNNIVAGLVCVALAVMIVTVFKGLVTGLVSGG